MSGPKVTVTARWLLDHDLWVRACEMTGLNEWAIREGLMISADIVTLTLSQAIELGIPDVQDDPEPDKAAPVVTIDPPDCGCTECMTGEYTPLDQAKPWQLALLFAGSAVNNTGLTFEYDATREVGVVHVIPLWEDGGRVADSVYSGQTEPRWRSVADGWTLEVTAR